MNQRPFGSTGDQVSVIGQGTWYLDHGDRKRAVAALRRGIELGMTHIDTAEMYGDAELVIADAIAGQRDGLFLSPRCCRATPRGAAPSRPASVRWRG
jgi:diketogulonate reductase-like aldo/keto reductase